MRVVCVDSPGPKTVSPADLQGGHVYRAAHLPPGSGSPLIAIASGLTVVDLATGNIFSADSYSEYVELNATVNIKGDL